MKSTVETLSPTRVRLSVEVPFDELKSNLAQAYKSIGQQVRVPGFRPGKVPSRLIDQRIGRQAVLEEAAHSAIPRYLADALREHDVKWIGRPEVAHEVGDGAPLTFTAEVDVRPEITLPDFADLQVTVDAVETTDEEVDAQVEALRDRFGTLKGVDRSAQVGDFVQIDLAATVDGEEVPGGTATGVSYEVGSKRLLDGLDDALVGMSAGEAATFRSELVGGDLAGREAEVSVTVGSVREKELPPLDDSFAELASEFDTLTELRDDLRGRIANNKNVEQAYQARDKTLEALFAAIDMPLPEGVAREEADHRKQAMLDQLERMGATLEEYLASEQKSEEDFDAELAASAQEAVRTQLVLDAVADAEELGVGDQEFTEEVLRRAQSSGMPPQEYAEQLQRSGQIPALAADIRRGKALALIVERATIVDTGGNPVDLSPQRVAAADDNEDEPAG